MNAHNSSFKPSLEFPANETKCSFFTSRLQLADGVQSGRWIEMWQGSFSFGTILIYLMLYIKLYFLNFLLTNTVSCDATESPDFKLEVVPFRPSPSLRVCQSFGSNMDVAINPVVVRIISKS